MTKKITLNELKTLVKKIIKEEVELNEYDRETFDSKYGNLPTDRKNKIMDYSKERQIKNGISFTSDKDHVLYITPSDISISTTSSYNTIDKFINTMKNASKICSGKYKSSDGKIDYEGLHNDFKGVDFTIFDKNLIGINPSIKNFTLYLDINNVVSGQSGNERVVGYVSGTLVKLEDKYNPPFEFNIDSIGMSYASMKVLPTSQKDNVRFIKGLQDAIISEFNNPREYLYIKTVKIDRNSFYTSRKIN